ncbi:MAG: nuclease-related domain-containing protein [Solirubrobacteraceae bacterium]
MDAIDRAAGEFAWQQFKARRRAWRRRVWWAVPLLAAMVGVPVVVIGALADPQHIAFYLGIGVGAAAASVLCLWDSPPAHIERWRQGAQGEQQTARALRPLAREGWIVLNDLPRQYGNIDHVAIGPPGVFLVETKNVGGIASVTDDALIVRWLEDPDDGYTNTAIGRRARGAAAELSRTLGAAGERTWVQAIVVLWGRFEQERHEEQRVIWTHGSQLREILRSQTAIRLTPAAVAQLADHIRAAASRTSTDLSDVREHGRPWRPPAQCP